MGYAIQAYTTDAAKIKQIFGSKDKKLQTEVEAQLAERLADLNDDFDLEEDEVTAHTILNDLFDGVIRHPEQAHLYGYVYEMLCACFGASIEPENDMYALEFLDLIVKEYSAFIAIPFSGDFPHIVSIEYKDLDAFKKKYLRDEDDEQVRELADTIEHARVHSKDLVFFNY